MHAQASSSFKPLLAVAVAALGVIAGFAQAAPDDLQRVEITGRRPGEVVHTNVRKACPGIEGSLQESLAKVQYRDQREGVTTVSFRLSGDEMTEIRQRGGPFEYRDEVRRAVRKLSCNVAGSNQLHVMQIAFRNEDPMSDAPRNVALLGE